MTALLDLDVDRSLPLQLGGFQRQLVLRSVAGCELGGAQVVWLADIADVDLVSADVRVNLVGEEIPGVHGIVVELLLADVHLTLHSISLHLKRPI